MEEGDKGCELADGEREARKAGKEQSVPLGAEGGGMGEALSEGSGDRWL